jgi:4-diphosphocytidyl-2-C-methyl-D-erythritol kinase
MRVPAFAKINLSLRVLGTRADGFHELRTTFQSIALHDTLTIRPSRGPFRLTCDDPGCPAGETNLIWRAAAALWTRAGRRGVPRDVVIDLQKRIPMQAGLGGGSSDAAAVLRVLGRMWRVDPADVSETGAELGADIPYFFEGGTVLGLERGDLLYPLIDYPPAWVVLVVPDFGVSTKAAFAWWDEAKARRPRGSGRRRQSRGAELVNDLEAAVVAHHPSLRGTVSALKNAGATHAAMSGTGSAVFGLFGSRDSANQAAKALTSRSRRTLVTHTLNRAKYQALAAN